LYYCRPEREGDETTIHQLNAAAFPSPAEAELVDALRVAGRLAISLVAADADGVVGHIAFSPVTAGEHEGLGLAPVAVREAHRRRGVAAMLVREGLAACEALRSPFVVVLGDPAYYGRFGFVRAADFGLGNEYDVHDEFMVLALQSGGIPPRGTLVRYAPEFAWF